MSVPPVSVPKVAPLPAGINLGCGMKPMADCLNVDRSKAAKADQRFDLLSFPWPLPQSHFERVFAFDVLEHLPDLPTVMNEILRVSRPGAVLHVTAPHFSCRNAFVDPTHCHYFGWDSFGFFCEGGALAPLENGEFKLLSRKIFFETSLLNRLIGRLANRWPDVYERKWAWMFPAWFMEIRLEAKPKR